MNDPRKSLERQFTVSGFVLNRDRKILLINHRKLGVWLYPGGHVETNETPDQAIIREIKEETNIDACLLGRRNIDLADQKTDVTVLHTPYQILCEYINDPKDPHYHIDMVYICRALNGECKINDEVKGAAFFDEESSADLALFPSFRKLLNNVYNDDDIWGSYIK